MKVSGVGAYFFVLAMSAGLAWYCTRDKVTCIVKGSGDPTVNGYYAAYDGRYIRRGSIFNYTPTFFDMSHIRDISEPFVQFQFQGVQWSILFGRAGKTLIAYVNTPSEPQLHLTQPPSTGWGTGASGVPPPPAAVTCSGSLADSPSLLVSPTDNIEGLIRRPVTTFLLLLNLAVGYHLWANGVDVSSVSFSYEAVVSGQYWRMVTASFSHFDLLHIGFNLMSLYQLGGLEAVYGSTAFFYLNLDLVFLTMLVVVVICYLRISYFAHSDVRLQQSVGFSCVLFAWMVVASVRMSQYCPLFFMPSLCFETWLLKIPFSNDLAFPVNLGPFVLLFVTKLILTRSSLVGHLSGIIIGFPVAWNLLNWLTPGVLAVALMLIMFTFRELWPWKLPGYETLVEALAEEDPSAELLLIRRLKGVSVVFIGCSLYGLYASDLFSVSAFCRVIMAMLCYSSHHVLRCLWLSDLRGTKLDALTILGSVSVALAVLVLEDVMSLSSVLTTIQLLTQSCDKAPVDLLRIELFYLTIILIQMYILYLLMVSAQKTPEAKYMLRLMFLDDDAVRNDVQRITGAMERLPGSSFCFPQRDPFSQRGHSLGHDDEHQGPLAETNRGRAATGSSREDRSPTGESKRVNIVL